MRMKKSKINQELQYKFKHNIKIKIYIVNKMFKLKYKLKSVRKIPQEKIKSIRKFKLQAILLQINHI